MEHGLSFGGDDARKSGLAMTPEERKQLIKDVGFYMNAMSRGDHEDRAKLRKRVIRQYASDHCTGSGKTCDEMEAEITKETGDFL